VTATRFAALAAPALLAASAIAHATAGPSAAGATLVAVGDGPGNVATGFTVSAGRVVTVAHVLEGGATTVRGADGVARRAAVVRRDDTLDLALLAVRGVRPAAGLTPAGTRMLANRDGRVAAVPVRVLRRIDARVRSPGADVARRSALELAVAASAGDSGAPIVRNGRVTGVLFARSSERAGVAYAVDGSALQRLLR
jgi:hypothetical protein